MSSKQHTVVLQKRSHQQNFGIYVGDDVPSGIYIVTIAPDSPASDANIQPGDRILAINGQLVSSMSKDPKEILSRIATHAPSLTLSMQSSSILQSLNGFLANDFSSAKKQSVFNENSDAYHIPEKLIKSVFSNERVHLTRSRVNPNEYFFTSDYHSPRPHRKRRRYASKQTQTSSPDEQIIDLQPLSALRSIPSMGTSHVMLRNSQLNPRDTLVQEPNIQKINIIPNNGATYNSQAALPFSRLPVNNPIANHGMPRVNQYSSEVPFINGDGLREIRIRRSPNFQGFGFHLHYNMVYYIVDRIETNSPAAGSGLRAKDVILKINNQPTDKMSHAAFVQIVVPSRELILLVQPFNDYARLHPEVKRRRDQRTNPSTIKSDDTSSDYNQTTSVKPQKFLSRTLSKLKSR